MTNLTRSNFQAHPFHLVTPSPWPISISFNLLTLTTTGVLSMHNFAHASTVFFLALSLVMYTMALWFRDIISEATYLGNHTLAVQRGINMGVALFIVSEALFFLTIFWTFFHSGLSPNIELGAQWPPMGIQAINPFELPLFNTVILLSVVVITYAHHSLIQGNRAGSLYGLVYTILLAMIFTGFQGVEYSVSGFSISDGIYGSFFGFFFFFGTIFLAVGLWRVLAYLWTENHPLGFKKVILYSLVVIRGKFLEWTDFLWNTPPRPHAFASSPYWNIMDWTEIIKAIWEAFSYFYKTYGYYPTLGEILDLLPSNLRAWIEALLFVLELLGYDRDTVLSSEFMKWLIKTFLGGGK